MKTIADNFDISILLVHHTRKSGSSDPFATISGTTGLSGGVDGSMVMLKPERQDNMATLNITGRFMNSLRSRATSTAQQQSCSRFCPKSRSCPSSSPTPFPGCSILQPPFWNRTMASDTEMSALAKHVKSIWSASRRPMTIVTIPPRASRHRHYRHSKIADATTASACERQFVCNYNLHQILYSAKTISKADRFCFE